jgi:hypothetical protein
VQHGAAQDMAVSTIVDLFLFCLGMDTLGKRIQDSVILVHPCPFFTGWEIDLHSYCDLRLLPLR